MSVQPINNNDKLTPVSVNTDSKAKADFNLKNAVVSEDRKDNAKVDERKNLNKSVGAAVERFQSLLNRDVVMAVDKALNRVTVKLIDSETGDVVREIPPEDVLNIAKKTTTIEGLLFDKEV
ncbi:MAG: flagellar protein FlaG [Deltaproteobacteria bacterium]|nr:flagellar protein FlaG [Deltaproteobacteria bacterium]